jgi:threonine dehydratase
MSNQSPVVTPTLAEFEAAHAIVAQVAIETPVLHSNFLSKLTGADVWLKAETLQQTVDPLKTLTSGGNPPRC